MNFRPALLSLFFAILLPACIWAQSSTAVTTKQANEPPPERQVELRNGDVLTGIVATQPDGSLVLISPILGTIVLPKGSAKLLPNTGASLESLVGLPPQQPQGPKDSTAVPVVVAPPPPPQSKKAAKPETPHWKGKVEFGFQQQSGQKQTLNTSLRLNAERKARHHNLLATARVLYGEQNDATNTDKLDSSFRWRYDVSERVFTQSLSSYARDEIRKIDINVEQNIGMGFRVWDAKRHVVNVGAGVTGQYREAANIDDGITILGEVFQDYTLKLNGRVTFIQDAFVQFSPNPKSSFVSATNTNDDLANFNWRFNTTLQGKITNHVSMNVRFEYQYDNAVADPQFRTDRRITSSLGYAF